MLKVSTRRISGTEQEIDTLIMAARMDGCWDTVVQMSGVRVMMRAIVNDNPYISVSMFEVDTWDQLQQLAFKLGGEYGK